MSKWRYTGFWIAIEISKNLIMILCINIALGKSIANGEEITIILLLYSIAVTPFTLVLSHLIQEVSTAILVGVIYQLVIGGVSSIIVFILRVIPSTSEYGDQLLNKLR